MSTISDYLQAVSAGNLVPNASKWVRLVNNSSGTAYVSTAATDVNGLFTVAGPPPGAYTVSTGPSSVGPWTGTGDTNYLVPLSSGDDAALKSGTFLTAGPYTSTAPAGAITGISLDNGGAVYNVKHQSIGAKVDGATDDTTALGVAGGLNGVRYIPAGTCIVSGVVSSTVSGTWRGAGKNSTFIQSSSTTNDGFRLTGDHSVVEDLYFSNTQGASQSAGTAIVFQAANFPVVNRCTILWYNGVKNVAGYGWIVTNCYITPIHYGIYQQNAGSPDSGDPSITNNTIDLASNAGSCVRIESGGGPKITGNKFVNGQYAVDLQIPDGVTTSILIINGNSMEVQTKACVRASRSGTTGVWSSVLVTNNQMNLSTATAAVDCVLIGAGVSIVEVTGNVMRGHITWSNAIRVATGGDNVTVSANSFTDHLVAVKVDGNCDLFLGPNKYRHVTTAWSSAQTANTTPDPLHVHEHRADLGNITSTVTYTNFYRIDFPVSCGGTLEVVISGIVQGKGGFSNRYHKLLVRDAGNLTATDITGPSLAGQVIDSQFDVTTTAGAIYVGVRVNAGGGGTAVNGQIQIRATGFISQLQQLVL